MAGSLSCWLHKKWGSSLWTAGMLQKIQSARVSENWLTLPRPSNTHPEGLGACGM